MGEPHPRPEDPPLEGVRDALNWIAQEQLGVTLGESQEALPK